MATETEIRTRLSEIDTILATGARTVVVDGVTTVFDPASLREERKRLERQLPEAKFKRPLAYRPKLG